jgi:hypothetical protein
MLRASCPNSIRASATLSRHRVSRAFHARPSQIRNIGIRRLKRHVGQTDKTTGRTVLGAVGSKSPRQADMKCPTQADMLAVYPSC